MATATRLPPAHDVVELRKCLSENATISPVGGDEGTPARPRWSTYEPPQPKYVVKVATEEDVARTVSTFSSIQTDLIVRRANRSKC